MTKKLNMTPEMDAELDALFAQARDEAPVPSADLLARLAQDAAQTQASFGRVVEAPLAPRMSWWAHLIDDIGGLPAMGGLVASACVGIYLGFVNPDFATGLSSTETEVTAEAAGVMSHALLGDLYWIEEG